MNEKSAPITPLTETGKVKEDLTATQAMIAPTKRPNDLLAASDDDVRDGHGDDDDIEDSQED